jgi:predicted transcriptional regulator
MPIPSFHEWLATRPDDALAADRLATVIASAGAEGVPADRLRRLCGLPPETLADVLKALVATGQVMVVKVNGEFRYRATA